MRVSAYDNNNRFQGGSSSSGYISKSTTTVFGNTYYRETQFLNLHSWTSQDPQWKNNRAGLPSTSVDVYGEALRSQHYFSSDIPVNTCQEPLFGPSSINILSTKKKITFNSSSLGSISYMDKDTQNIFSAEGVWNQVSGIRLANLSGSGESPKEVYEHSGRPGHFLRYYNLTEFYGEPQPSDPERYIYDYKFWGFCIGDEGELPAYTSGNLHFQNTNIPGRDFKELRDPVYGNITHYLITYERETDDPTVYSLGIYNTGDTSGLSVTTQVV